MIRHRSIAFVNLFLINSTLRISLITKSSRKSKNRRKRVGVSIGRKNFPYAILAFPKGVSKNDFSTMLTYSFVSLRVKEERSPFQSSCTRVLSIVWFSRLASAKTSIHASSSLEQNSILSFSLSKALFS